MSERQANTVVGDCQPNYEEEYYRNIEKIVKLERENAELKNTIIAMCKTFCKGGAE